MGHDVHAATRPAGAERVSRRWLIRLVVAPSALAWLALAVIGAEPFGRYFRHQRLASSRGSAPLVLLGWIVMIAAMMVPTTVPLLASLRRLVSDQPHPDRLLVDAVLGYVAVWTLVGGLAVVGDTMLHALATRAVPAGGDPLIAAGVLAVAGIYQFTPWKRRCRSCCHAPAEFVEAHWSGGDPTWAAFSLGAAHGWYCVGCCSSLMLTMFALGMGNVVWMLAFGAVIAIEKNVPRARVLSPLLGIGLITGAFVVLAAR
jgi:predicted metal-binding membrane protein